MYDEFYSIVLRVVDIAFEDFASLVQTLLVEHIRKTMSAEAATWYKEWYKEWSSQGRCKRYGQSCSPCELSTTNWFCSVGTGQEST